MSVRFRHEGTTYELAFTYGTKHVEHVRDGKQVFSERETCTVELWKEEQDESTAVTVTRHHSDKPDQEQARKYALEKLAGAMFLDRAFRIALWDAYRSKRLSETERQAKLESAPSWAKDWIRELSGKCSSLEVEVRGLKHHYPESEISIYNYGLNPPENLPAGCTVRFSIPCPSFDRGYIDIRYREGEKDLHVQCGDGLLIQPEASNSCSLRVAHWSDVVKLYGKESK